MRAITFIKVSSLLTTAALLCTSCSSYYARHHQTKPMPLTARSAPPSAVAAQDPAAQTQGAQFAGGIHEADEMNDVDTPYNNRGEQQGAVMASGSLPERNQPEAAVDTRYLTWAARTQNPKCLISQPTPGTEQHYFFDTNKSSVHDEFVRSVQNQAHFLIQHPTVKVRIEGNADERGSREYNVALAARRAKSVVALFKQQGVPSRQFTMVSYGAEKPAVKGENAEAYHCNRRVDIVYEVDSNA